MNAVLTEALEFLGRLHVVVLHLPIGILVALGFVELRAWWRSRGSPPAAWSLTVLGSASAVVTAASGVLLSWRGRYDPELLFRHQWLGIAVAGLSLVVVALRAGSGSAREYRGALVLTLVLLALGGHQGGSLTHGSDFLFPTASTGETVEVAPAMRVLEAHCHECHGSSKQESGLRLDDRGAMLAGGESGEPAVVPGRATASELIRRITLPRDDDDAMPPDGRARPSAEDILALIDWINAGASLEPAFAFEAAPVEVLGELRAAGLEVEPLAENDPRLAARLPLGAEDAASEPLLALTRVARQVVWLDLEGRALSEAEWEALASFENLTRAHLEQTNVADRHLEWLASAKRLEYVNLYDTGVGDAGLARLSGLPRLADVYVWQSRVTDEGVERFLEANPDVRVHRGVEP